jgi:hypothetical protein
VKGTPSEPPKTKVVPDNESLSFVRLGQLAIDEDAIPLRAKSSQKKFSLLLNDDLVLLLDSHREFVSLGQEQGEHSEVLDDRLAVNFDFQVAGELIEREFHPMLFAGPNAKTKLHFHPFGS